MFELEFDCYFKALLEQLIKAEKYEEVERLLVEKKLMVDNTNILLNNQERKLINACNKLDNLNVNFSINLSTLYSFKQKILRVSSPTSTFHKTLSKSP